MQPLGEDQVGGGKQGGEEDDHRQRDQDAAQDGPEAFPPGAGSDHGSIILSGRDG